MKFNFVESLGKHHTMGFCDHKKIKEFKGIESLGNAILPI